MNLDDVDREAAALADQEALLNHAWMWHLPHGQVEASVLGAAALGYAISVGVAAAVPAWPWWLRVGVSLVLIGPWFLVALLMAVRAWWTGVGPLQSINAAVPLMLWLLLIVALHACSLPGWAQWSYLPGYIAAAVTTVWWWNLWTTRTHALRRRIRWRREDDKPALPRRLT